MHSGGAQSMDTTVRIFTLVTLLMLLSGVGTISIRSTPARLLTTVFIAVISGTFLFLTEILARTQLQESVRVFASAMLSRVADSDPSFNYNHFNQSFSVMMGFWITLIGILAIIFVNLFFLVFGRWRAGYRAHRSP
jgi:hypothetical protein